MRVIRNGVIHTQTERGTVEGDLLVDDDGTIAAVGDVDADFALAEGENDSLEGWRRDHAAYFTRNGGFDPGMMLLCKRFEMVEDLATTEAA